MNIYKTERGQETAFEKQIAGLILDEQRAEAIDPDARCPVCGEPLYKRLTLPIGHAKERIVNLTCKCRRMETEAYEQRKKEEAREDARKKCFHGESAYYSYTFQNDDPEKNSNTATRNTYKILKELFLTPGSWEKYKAKTGGKAAGFVLSGPTGTGKTYLAAACCNAYIDQGESASFWRIAQLMETRAASNRRGEDPELFWERVLETTLLVVDDLAAERQDEKTREFVFELIDRRQKVAERGRCLTILTTNIPRKILKDGDKTANNRIYSRISENLAIFEMLGDDARKAGGNKMYAALLEVLNNA